MGLVKLIKRNLSFLLSFCILCTVLIEYPAKATSDGIPSIYVRHTRYNPFFVQEVYLEPDEEYVFSYLYSSLPASTEAFCYTDSNHNFQADNRSVSSKENRLTRSFRTVSIDADGVQTGTGENSGKIKSYIGIRMYADKTNIANDNTDYTGGKCIYGDFRLYKMSDTSKTNLFRDTEFENISFDSSGNGCWTSLPAANSNFALINFGKYDADPQTSDTIENPTADFFECPFSELCVKLISISQSPYFVQNVWLKPDTYYTFSYCYSKTPATKNIIYKSLAESSEEYDIISVTEDDKQKRVYCNFKTSSLTDSSVIKGSGNNADKILAVIGLHFSNTERTLLGGYYADLQVYESEDEEKNNLLSDLRYESIGTGNSSKTWHGITNSKDPSSSVKKVTNLSSSAFDRCFTVYAADTEGGEVTLSQSYAFPGESVTVNVNASDGYRVASVTANDVELNCIDGKCSFTPTENTTVKARFESCETIPSIYVLHTRYSPNFVQEVWLEPDTEYVFSYLFSNLPACAEALFYTDTNHQFSAESRTYSTEEKRLIRSFKTVPLDTAGVERGTGENADKIKSYIGIRMYPLEGTADKDDTRYTDKKCLYGGFLLYKKSDSTKTNLFKNQSNPFGSIEYKTKGEGDWINLGASGSNFAQMNYSRCAVDSVGKAEYEKSESSPSIKVKDIVTHRSPYLVHTIWLKPNTTYTLSYMYSDSLPSRTVAMKDLNEHSYTLSEPYYDNDYNRVSYDFTTTDKNDSQVTYDSATGLLKTYVGIRFYDTATDLIGTYYGGFTLSEKSETLKTNLLFDNDLFDMGKISDNTLWNGFFQNNDSKTSFQCIADISMYVYKKRHSINCIITDNGRLSSASSALSGETVYLSAVANDGYYFKGFSTDSGITEDTFGKNTAITMPTENVNIAPYFAEIIVGDCNSDGIVDILDLVKIKKYVAGNDTDIVFENADCNKNGTIDSDDIIYVKKIIMGIENADEDTTPITGGYVNMNQTGGADAAANEMRTAIRSSTDNLQSEGRVFYVSDAGNDSNSGTSINDPIKTIDRLKQLSLSSGDTVLFKRGSVFRINSRYDAVAGVKYGAYGDGEKPRIYGSEKNYADSLWSATEYNNVWKFPLSKVVPTSGDVGLIVFNCNQFVGTKQYYIEALKEDGYFYYDYDEQAVYLYCSQGNPSDVYSDIEIGRKMNMILPASGVTIDNIGLFYTGAHAIACTENTSNLKITNCEIGWIGGSSHMDTRYGNGIQLWNGCQNIEITGCYIYQVFDAAITFQGDNLQSEYKNINIRNNLIEYCSWSFEWWNGYENPYVYSLNLCDNGEISDITVDSNIMRFEGYGWSRATRKPATIQGPWGVRTYKNISDFVVSNNIFDCPNGLFVRWIQSGNLPDQTGYAMSGNSYYRKYTDTNVAFNFGKQGETFASNQIELENAVHLFEINPSTVQWIE